MKNIKYKLGDPIPNRIRLSCYKKALAYYKQYINAINRPGETKYPKIGKFSHIGGICLLLPVLLWDLSDYLVGDWNFTDTPKSFPEIQQLVDELENTLLTNQDKVELRIKHLELIIESFKLF